ncbi:unnamed protein product [Pleuronectes platessa]|uniref:Uncharacterized protein n=1 Tax=Pleuronectes platessa TaxID=8262 RepID=A0A9N7Y8A7_PLEPL|nr:unnamed protein product [Pleuronectes platessa]
MPLLTLACLIGIPVTKTVRFIFDYFLPAIDEDNNSESNPAALLNLRENQHEIGPAVLDTAASLDTGSTAALFQVALALSKAADTVCDGTAALERSCLSSLPANAPAPPEETSWAAVFHHSERFLDAADAVYNSAQALYQTGSDVALFDTAVAAFYAAALQDETSVSVVDNLAVHFYSAANALRNLYAALESTSGQAAGNLAVTWYNATVTVNNVATALTDDSPARAVFDAAVAVLNATASASALFKDAGDGVGLGDMRPLLHEVMTLENVHFADSM